MDYFFIAGSVASLVSLIAFVLQVGHYLPDDKVVRYAILLAVALTGAFWIYFYLAPRNRVRKAIRDRLDFAGSYTDSSNRAIEVFEGEFTLSDFGVHTISIPPFEETPTVTIYSEGKDAPKPLTPSRVSLDSFEVSAWSGDQWRTWRFRARGPQLKRRQDPA